MNPLGKKYPTRPLVLGALLLGGALAIITLPGCESESPSELERPERLIQDIFNPDWIAGVRLPEGSGETVIHYQGKIDITWVPQGEALVHTDSVKWERCRNTNRETACEAAGTLNISNDSLIPLSLSATRDSLPVGESQLRIRRIAQNTEGAWADVSVRVERRHPHGRVQVSSVRGQLPTHDGEQPQIFLQVTPTGQEEPIRLQPDAAGVIDAIPPGPVEIWGLKLGHSVLLGLCPQDDHGGCTNGVGDPKGVIEEQDLAYANAAGDNSEITRWELQVADSTASRVRIGLPIPKDILSIDGTSRLDLSQLQCSAVLPDEDRSDQSSAALGVCSDPQLETAEGAFVIRTTVPYSTGGLWGSAEFVIQQGGQGRGQSPQQQSITECFTFTWAAPDSLRFGLTDTERVTLDDITWTACDP